MKYGLIAEPFFQHLRQFPRIRSAMHDGEKLEMLSYLLAQGVQSCYFVFAGPSVFHTLQFPREFERVRVDFEHAVKSGGQTLSLLEGRWRCRG